MARVFVTSNDGPGVVIELRQSDNDGSWAAECPVLSCWFEIAGYPTADAIQEVGTHLDKRH